jgi:DNA-nicking Smr family endonuclease
VKAKKKKARGGPFEALLPLKRDLEKKEHEAASKKSAPSPTAKSTAPAEPEDEVLSFHRLFAGVAPLDRSRAGRVPRQRIERSAAAEQASRYGAETERAEAEAVHERLRTLVEGATRFEVADDGEHVEGRRVDVPMSALRRLRRGLLPIDGRADLHGLTVDEARVRLDVFLRAMRTRGERCVLVIHGKGRHSVAGVAVLRGEVSAWLSQGAASAHVAAFATARSEDGGQGAMYVLLRK